MGIKQREKEVSQLTQANKKLGNDLKTSKKAVTQLEADLEKKTLEKSKEVKSKSLTKSVKKDSWNPMDWSLPAKIVSGIASFCALCPILCWFVSSSSETPQGAQALVESAKSNLFVWALPALG